MVTATIDWVDIVWTLTALVGLFLWTANLREAWRSLRAARSHMITNGRLVWARFGVYLTGTMVGVELVFLLLGFNAMTRAPALDGEALVTRWVSVLGFLAVSGMLALLAYRWGEVDRTIVRMAIARQAGREPR